MKWLLALIIALCFTATVEARYCNNPNCAMCNRIFGYMPGYGPRQPAAPAAPAIPEVDSSPQPVVEAMLGLVKPKSTEVVYDLGCGDGRIVITAAKKYGCKAVGVEIDKAVAELAKQKVKEAGVSDLVTIIHGDASEQSLADADVIVLYLFPETMEKLYPAIFRAHRIASYSHPLPQVDNTKIVVDLDGEPHPVYLWSRDQYGGMLPPETFLAETSVPPKAAPEPPKAAPKPAPTKTYSNTRTTTTTQRRGLFSRWRRR